MFRTGDWRQFYLSLPPRLIRSAKRTIAAPNAVALTFDDGPHPEATPRALDALGKRNMKATFFLLGSRCERYPDIAKRIIDEGHAVGSHGYDHIRHIGNPKTIVESLTKSILAIEQATATAVRYFRPPYGWWLPTNNLLLHERELQLVLWSLMPGDFLNSSTPLRLHEVLASRLRSGDVVVLHDNAETAERVAGSVRCFADVIENRNFSTMLLSDER